MYPVFVLRNVGYCCAQAKAERRSPVALGISMGVTGLLYASFVLNTHTVTRAIEVSHTARKDEF